MRRLSRHCRPIWPASCRFLRDSQNPANIRSIVTSAGTIRRQRKFCQAALAVRLCGFKPRSRPGTPIPRTATRGSEAGATRRTSGRSGTRSKVSRGKQQSPYFAQRSLEFGAAGVREARRLIPRIGGCITGRSQQPRADSEEHSTSKKSGCREKVRDTCSCDAQSKRKA